MAFASTTRKSAAARRRSSSLVGSSSLESWRPWPSATPSSHAPYAAGREWALTLPDARLITVERAAHQLVTDAPEIVLPAIDEFVSGRWPSRAEKITTLERSPM